MKNDQDSQRILIEAYLKKGATITDAEARTDGFNNCSRLASVIFNLRKRMDIETEMKPNLNNNGRHAVYFIKDL
jgi:hypothetical protein